MGIVPNCKLQLMPGFLINTGSHIMLMFLKQTLFQRDSIHRRWQVVAEICVLESNLHLNAVTDVQVAAEVVQRGAAFSHVQAVRKLGLEVDIHTVVLSSICAVVVNNNIL